jgi:predicted nucleic acid-binding protein
VGRVALDASVVIAFLDPGDAHHTTAVAELQPALAAGDDLFVGASVYAETIIRPDGR